MWFEILTCKVYTTMVVEGINFLGGINLVGGINFARGLGDVFIEFFCFNGVSDVV